MVPTRSSWKPRYKTRINEIKSEFQDPSGVTKIGKTRSHNDQTLYKETLNELPGGQNETPAGRKKMDHAVSLTLEDRKYRIFTLIDNLLRKTYKNVQRQQSVDLIN